MRHRKGNKKLGKATDQRIAMLRALAKGFFETQRITTTDTRAKEVRKFIDRIITLGKNGDLKARRAALKLLPNPGTIQQAFGIAKQVESRNGGYTRITKLGFRRGDAAPVSVVELVD